MKKISYSKDVDILLLELSEEPIAYAEDEGNVILHYDRNDKLRAALDRGATLIVENVRNLPGLLESVRTCNGNLTDARARVPQAWSHGPAGNSDLRSLWAKPIPLGFVVWRFFEIAFFDERSDRATEGGLAHVAGDGMVSHIRGFRHR